MFTIKRSSHNPLLAPDTNDPWEGNAVFNWCPARGIKNEIHYVYRAMSSTELYYGTNISISSVGYVKSTSSNGIDFSDRRQLIAPEYAWERYGCEDPRVTKINGHYYIFYTALSNYPYNADGIKIAVAITRDFKTIKEKHLVTPFNAKAMVLFPEKINGKYVAILSVDTDRPPHEKICIAEFDSLEEMWDEEYWNLWYSQVDSHVIDPRRSITDHIEVGAVPIKTKAGWLFVYSYIENYRRENNPFPVDFGIEALLFDLKDPKKIIGKTEGPMFVASEIYEKSGQIANIVFPSGALLQGENLDIFYGAADSVCCKASVHLDSLLASLKPNAMSTFFTRYLKNPILSPRAGVAWEAKGVLNPGVLEAGGIAHILYRAQGADDTSTIGYASSKDGYSITTRFDNPIYVPRESFEMKTYPGNSGCEDPRLTLIGGRVYMCYTAYDGTNPPRVALTSIPLADFVKQNWVWKTPILISPRGTDDKDACIFPEKINGKYLVLHRVNLDICADYVDSLDFLNGPLATSAPILLPRRGMWDSEKVGISAPPIKTKHGWILLYHGISSIHHTYRVGVALLDLKHPHHVIARCSQPILRPEAPYEKNGFMSNVVFPCGAIIRKDTLFVYYGGADTVVGVATISMKKLLDSLL
jgi:predicted GH43/DUF377 family glycosyl hydrolase